MMGSYGGGLFFWFINLLIGFNGNFFDYITLYITKIMVLAPLATLYYNFQSSASYGTADQVTLNTEWAETVESDEYYSLTFNSVLFLSIIDFVIASITWMPLGKQVKDKREAANIAKAESNPDGQPATQCDYGMLLGTNGLCYYEPSEEWNW